jgi:dsDNA-specific endonuclease/ATPase MutS2
VKNQRLEKEVDLHIEELLDNWSGMSNAQLLDVQLRRVQQELDEAIANRYQRIIFIHGIGNGRLKAEVLRILGTYKGIRFHDASYQRFGFGATEVEIF